MPECWETGVVLSGVRAGSLCWHLGGPTDSFRDALDPFDDGVGLHYVGTRLHEAVAVRRGSRAWWVEADGDGGHVERAVPTRYLGP